MLKVLLDKLADLIVGTVYGVAAILITLFLISIVLGFGVLGYEAWNNEPAARIALAVVLAICLSEWAFKRKRPC